MRKTDVIIPVYAPDQEFGKMLSSLKAQTLPVRIIIVNTDRAAWDSCGGDEMVKAAGAEEITTVRHIEKSEFNHGLTRNLGVTLSDAEVFVCMTQDAVPADRFLLERLTGSLSGKIRAAYARQLARAGSAEIERISREFNYPEKSAVRSVKDIETCGIKAFFCSNVCAAYDRRTFDVLGGFTETDFNEDMIYARKLLEAGYEIAYCAEARVIHSHNLSGIAQLKRNYLLGKSQKMHPETFGGIRSEGEGIRLVKTSARQLIDRGRWYEIPKLVWLSGCKYIGFLAGKL